LTSSEDEEFREFRFLVGVREFTIPNSGPRLLAENAALSTHAFICEGVPELPKVPGPHAEIGGEILKRMYAEGCPSLSDSPIGRRRNPGSLFPSDDDDEEMTYDQERLIRRFRKGRRPDAVLGAPPRPAGNVPT
jgi:hypothetical protein